MDRQLEADFLGKFALALEAVLLYRK